MKLEDCLAGKLDVKRRCRWPSQCAEELEDDLLSALQGGTRLRLEYSSGLRASSFRSQHTREGRDSRPKSYAPPSRSRSDTWSFQASLFQNAIQRPRRQVVAQLPCDRHQAGFGAMFELPMAALRAGQGPAIVLNKLDCVPDLHVQCTLGVVNRQRPERCDYSMGWCRTSASADQKGGEFDRHGLSIDSCSYSLTSPDYSGSTSSGGLSFETLKPTRRKRRPAPRKGSSSASAALSSRSRRPVASRSVVCLEWVS